MDEERGRIALSVVLAVLLTGLVMRFGLSGAAARPVQPVAVDDAPIHQREAKTATSYASVVKQVAPTVVNIFSSKTVENPLARMQPFANDPLMGQLFGDEGRARMPQTFTEQSLGSGTIVTKDGYVLTNNHVVEGAEEVKVALAGGPQDIKARVIGRDAKTDLAVVKIESDDLPTITFGDSDHLEVGDVVLALGNPFGVGQTVTSGIISAVRRGLGVEEYEDFIQTDAAINPGNSGGPLVDVQGRLVGVSTAILSRSGGNMGIGFAVPVNTARRVMEQLIRNGKVTRGALGVSIQDLTPDLAKQFNTEGSEGALVGEVVPEGAAAESGMHSGDIIVEFDHKPVKDSRSLKLMVGDTAPGTKVELKVLRDGAAKTMFATLKESREKQSKPAAVQRPEKKSSDLLAGVTIADLTPAARAELRIPEKVQGVMVADIDPAAPAFAAGLHEGDVIQEINRKPTSTSAQAMVENKRASGKPGLLKVWSRGKSGYVSVGAEQ